jgi:hypothetical protein
VQTSGSSISMYTFATYSKTTFLYKLVASRSLYSCCLVEVIFAYAKFQLNLVLLWFEIHHFVLLFTGMIRIFSNFFIQITSRSGKKFEAVPMKYTCPNISNNFMFELLVIWVTKLLKISIFNNN